MATECALPHRLRLLVPCSCSKLCSLCGGLRPRWGGWWQSMAMPQPVPLGLHYVQPPATQPHNEVLTKHQMTAGLPGAGGDRRSGQQRGQRPPPRATFGEMAGRIESLGKFRHQGTGIEIAHLSFDSREFVDCSRQKEIDHVCGKNLCPRR